MAGWRDFVWCGFDYGIGALALSCECAFLGWAAMVMDADRWEAGAALMQAEGPAGWNQ